MVEKTGSILDQLKDPSELRKLKVDQLPEVCTELRDFINNLRQAAEFMQKL